MKKSEAIAKLEKCLESSELGPTGDPKCPLCGMSMGNCRIAWDNRWRCISCKILFQYNGKSDT